MIKSFNSIPKDHPAQNPTKRLFRFHSGGTVMDSVASAVEVTDIKEVAKLCRARGWEFTKIEINPYAYDERIDWLTYLVTVDGMAVGYTNHHLKSNVIHRGNLTDRKSREIVLTVKDGIISARRIHRKITMSDAFKAKYPKATTIEHTDRRTEALKLIEQVDWDLMSGKTVPACTVIIDGKCHHYSKVTGQWWDIEMIKYWNGRLSDVTDHHKVRTLEGWLEVIDDHVWVVFSKKIAESKSVSVSYQVMRNSDIISEVNNLELHPGEFDSIYHNTALFPVSDLDVKDSYILVMGYKLSRYRFINGKFKMVPLYSLGG